MEVLNHLVLRGRAGVLGIVNADDDQLGNENAVNDQCRVAGNSIGPMHKFSQHYVSDFERSTIIMKILHKTTSSHNKSKSDQN